MKYLAYFWTRFLPVYPKTLVYMLQSTEYRFVHYTKWLSRTTDFRSVMRRKRLVMTKKARLLLTLLWVVALVLAALISLAVAMAIYTEWSLWWIVAVGILIVAPYVMSYGILLPLGLGWLLIQKPREKMMIRRAQRILADHPARRIAILGSYGKTTAKEMLNTVLSESFVVAATPGNMNTAIGISRFAARLNGNEQILIFELGEEKPGDIRALSQIAHPDTAIITGINEAHLESFKTLERTVDTIYEINSFVPAERRYQNNESRLIQDRGEAGVNYSTQGVGEWKVSKVNTSIGGTEFVLKTGKKELSIHTSLLGLHTVGVTAAIAAIADDFGMDSSSIEQGFQKVVAFEHRMEPKPLHGAWIIDDTYNGNSDGVRAGLDLLESLEAKRKIYVTPGLVEQGTETERVHTEIGEQAAFADIVVLMRNSTTSYIEAGLANKHFKGNLLVIDDPLNFYTNLDQFVAAGDVVLMQNDWTDNYA